MGKGLEIAVVYRDADVVLRVEDFLARQHFPSFQDLNLEVNQGRLTVSGQVRSFHEKQVAMTVCQRVPGVQQFIDKIQVRE